MVMLMVRISKQEKMLVAAVSVSLALVQLATLLINEFFFKAKLFLETDQLFFLALIIALFPPAVVNFLDLRWRMSVDKNIPEFLRELSEAGRTGVTLTRALDLASKRRYGPLSKELGRVVAKLSWGGNYEDAMKDFAKRIDTKLAKRTSILLTEISRAGGEIREVLDIISKHIRELQSIEDERRSQLKIYVAIVYIAFFIFLFIDYILIVTFFNRRIILDARTGLEKHQNCNVPHVYSPRNIWGAHRWQNGRERHRGRVEAFPAPDHNRMGSILHSDMKVNYSEH
jgi:pilus assembly protein TadC